MSNNNIKATVSSENNRTKASVNPQKKLVVRDFSVNTIRLQDIFDIENVDSVNDGSVLLYNANNEVWEITNRMDNQNTKINGGHF